MKKTFIINGESVTVENLVVGAGHVSFTIGKNHYAMDGSVSNEGVLSLSALNHNQRGFVGGKLPKGGQAVFLRGLEAIVAVPESGRKKGDGAGATGTAHAAPMPGKILKVLVQAGQKVAAGEVLMVMEAMKLQLNIDAAYAGVVKDVCFAAGDLVSDGDVLVKLEKSHAAK